jgi:hypothetical protein
MLRPAGCIQEQLGFGIDSTDLGVQNQATNAFGEEGASRLPGLYDRIAKFIFGVLA